MSTRCQIVVKDNSSWGSDILFYRHSDGYPEGAMPTLQKFMDWVRRGIVRDNAEQSAGWLILIGAKEYSTNYIDGKDVPKEKLFEPNDDSSDGWKCGAYEPAGCRHGDIEYLYILNVEVKTIACYETNFDGEGFPDKEKDKLLFIDSAEKPWKPKESC